MFKKFKNGTTLEKQREAKKIGFLTAMILAVGTIIGAGIFFKNRAVFRNNFLEGAGLNVNIIFSVLSWVIAIIGIIAIAVALIELTSASKDNKGILTWIKNFTKPYISKISSVYWFLFYIPFSVVPLTMFMIQSIQDATTVAGSSTPMNGYLIGFIGFAIFAWLVAVSYFSIRLSGYLQWVLALIGNITPMIVIPIASFVIAGQNGINTAESYSPTIYASGISSMTRIFGLGLAIPAIMFSFDGFYTITALRSDMKEPKKVSTIMLMSVILVSFLYLFITIAVIISSVDGTVSGIGIERISRGLNIFAVSIIGVSVLSTLNGYAISVAPQLEQTYREKDIWIFYIMMRSFIKWFKLKNARDASFVLYFVILAFFFLTIMPVGLEAYRVKFDANLVQNSAYVQSKVGVYGSNVIYLYSFIDDISSFASIVAYTIISISILGGLINRKRNFIEVKRNKFFIPAGIIAVIFSFLAISLYIVGNIADLIIYRIENSINFARALIQVLVFFATMIIPNIIVLIELFVHKQKRNKAVVTQMETIKIDN